MPALVVTVTVAPEGFCKIVFTSARVRLTQPLEDVARLAGSGDSVTVDVPTLIVADWTSVPVTLRLKQS